MMKTPKLKLLSLTALFISSSAFAAFPGSTNTIVKTYQIKASADDAEETKSTGSVSLTNAYPTLDNKKLLGLRFAGVDVPKGAVIKSAYLRFYSGSGSVAGALNLTISGENVDNSGAFAKTTNNLLKRAKTANKVVWPVPNWSVPYVSQDEEKSIDVSSVVKEIVGRSGYAPGNAVSLFVEGDSANSRASYLYDYTVTYPTRPRMPRLIVEYEATTAACNTTPSILTSSTTYLPDYSYAGYAWGEQPIPNYSSASSNVTYVNATTYGATPNDASDDTQAILNAIAAYKNTSGMVVLYFPAGRYKVSNLITIDRSNFVIQGAGNTDAGTVFQIDIPLSNTSVTKSQDILNLESDWTKYGWPKEADGVPYSVYSWTGGFFYTHYNGNRYSRSTIADVTKAKRGTNIFTIANQAQTIKVGDVLRFEWANPADNSFVKYLVDNQSVTIGSGNSGAIANFVSQPVTVTAVNGTQITVKEPLMHDVGQTGQAWTARVRTTTFIENVGFENFKVDFPANVSYAGHHKEAGYNALHLTDAKNSWVRNVAVNNADSAVLVDFGKNNTIENVTTTGRIGHYNIKVGDSYGVRVKGFNLVSHAIHNPSLNTAATMTVYSSGYVDVAALDQHNGLNHQNLIEDVTVGYTPNLWDHGGSDSALPTAGSYNTFWNIRVKELPTNNLLGTVTNAPGARLIGLHSPGNTLSISYSPAPYSEAQNSCSSVTSLYNYQLQKRGFTPQ